MRAVKIGGIIVGAIVLIVLTAGTVLPSDYRVERSIEIAASPEVVFGEVNSLKKWDAWSPWIARDESIQNSFSGPDEGVGATASWTSDNSGDGSQTIKVSRPHSRIETELNFGSQGSATADWRFEAAGDGTRVTWGMGGDMPGPLGGLMASRMDGWIGADYEDGLARLKKHVEALPEPEPEPEPAAGTGTETEAETETGTETGTETEAGTEAVE